MRRNHGNRIHVLTIGVACLTVLCLHSVSAQDLRICHHKDAKQIYVGDAQVELMGAGGVRVLIDVAIRSALTRPPTAADILLITHQHYDHCDFDFLREFPGRKMYMAAGDLRVPGVHVRGIAASHSAALPARGMTPTNYIYVVDMEGMRVVHFGDLGQKTLTRAQKCRLRNIDVAFYGFLDEGTDSFYDIIEELRPRLIVPTHIAGIAALERAVASWPSFKKRENSIALNRNKLPHETTLLLLGDWAKVYGDSLQIPDWPGHSHQGASPDAQGPAEEPRHGDSSEPAASGRKHRRHGVRIADSSVVSRMR